MGRAQPAMAGPGQVGSRSGLGQAGQDQAEPGRMDCKARKVKVKCNLMGTYFESYGRYYRSIFAS